MKNKNILIFLIIFFINFISAVQICEVYDDFSSGVLDNSKWEIRQDPQGQPFTDEYGIIEEDGNFIFHIQQNEIGDRRTYLVPKYHLKLGESWKYTFNIVHKEGNYGMAVQLKGGEFNGFPLIMIGYVNGQINLDEFGWHHTIINFSGNRFDTLTESVSNQFYSTTWPAQNESGDYEIYIGAFSGHNGRMHIDFDNFKICKEYDLQSPCNKNNDELFCDDFESGTADKWINQNGNWNVVDNIDNNFYRQSDFIGGGSHWRWAVADFYEKDYSVEADMRYIEDGDFGMGFLMYSKWIVSDPSNDETLSVSLYPKYNQISLYVKENGSPVKEYISSYNFEKNRWYNVKAEVKNKTINIFLDNQIIISNISTNILNEGYFLLNTDDLKADFDNILIISNNPKPTLSERVSLLESWKEIIENWKQQLAETLNQIAEKLDNHEDRITELEENSESKNYFKYLTADQRKNIVCEYAKANGLTNYFDLGYNCTIYLRTSWRETTKICSCKVI